MNSNLVIRLTAATLLPKSHVFVFNRLLTSATSNKLLSCPLKCNHLYQRYFSQSCSRLVSKRLTTKKQNELNSDGCWSVIAYNLSQELKIEKAHKLLENFKEYQINYLPDDLQDEAIVLSLKTDISDNSTKPLATPLHDVFLFREGSIVFWGVPYDQQRRILYGLSSLKIDPYSSELIQEEREHLNYSYVNSIEKSRMSRDIVQLATKQKLDSLKLDQFAFSHAVTLSVKLAIWEAMLDQYIESVSGITDDMKSGKRLQLTRDQVFRKTGEIYELRHNINLSSDLLDLPDIYWDRPNQEVIFSSVASFLNIKKRTSVINEKLNNCCELMNLLAGHMNDRHHIRLEWMIIVLITVEVLFEIARFI